MNRIESHFERLELWVGMRAGLFYPPSRAVFWIVIAILMKASLFVYLNYDVLPTVIKSGVLFECSGDCHSYIGPAENWISNGNYAPDLRLPGYGAIYLAFRSVFDQAAAMNSLVLLQVLLSAASTYALARLASRVYPENQVVFYLVFLTYGMSTFVSIYDRQILTESLTTAAIIFGVWILISDPSSTGPWRGPFLAGSFLSWAFFMRPVTFPIIVFGAAYCLERDRTSNPTGVRRVKAVLACLLPFALTAGLWGLRNWKAHRTAASVVPSAISPGLDPLWRAFIGFHQSWGGNFIYWDPTADIHWFGYVSQEWDSTISPVLREPPSWVSTSKFGRKELLGIRESTLLACDKSLPPAARDKHRALAITQLDSFSAALKKERPFVFYVVAPLRATYRLIATSGTYNLFRRPFSELSFPARIIKLIMSGLYVSVVAFGLVGIIFGFRASWAWSLVAVIPVYLIGIHGAYFRFTENRYLVPAYPFLLVFANGYILIALQSMLKRRLPGSRDFSPM